VYVHGSISTFFPFNLGSSASVTNGTGYTGFIYYNKLQYGMVCFDTANCIYIFVIYMSQTTSHLRIANFQLTK